MLKDFVGMLDELASPDLSLHHHHESTCLQCLAGYDATIHFGDALRSTGSLGNSDLARSSSQEFGGELARL